MSADITWPVEALAPQDDDTPEGGAVGKYGPFEEVGITPDGYTLQRRRGLLGGWEYWTDECGAGVFYLYALHSHDAMRMALQHAEENP